ncbi:MAG: CPBP family intramembrane metalloprotease [Phycisphaerae bacterium]|nr:CPBP family intramembrane metalloprotease [Phycisphaerae bacterium]NIP54962.1 CPBP family intramembrane metalloprotease [Phycisphaerae bacterium]NIS52037.1 CPBP family intramembrane metalloprotease [Phycisphaerae bacterium]NIU07618.1 CPBP family intramembrane metalloprotease [Phycisphaerae bacterium]NIU57239.1 CPBP family intramembrane metalloprotease [Phycisphaerae bacterium]
MKTSEIIMVLICLPGLFLFGRWLLTTSLGRNALADSRPRRNNMRPYLCIIPPFILFVPIPLAMLITEKLAADLQDWQKAFLNNLIYCVGAIVVMVVIVFLVRASFARRLKGFGLNMRSIPKDFAAAFLYLLSVLPLIFAAMTLIMFIGRLFFGPEYEISKHEQLEIITAYPRWQLQISVFVVAVVIAPVIEEMIFRGLFQTVIRSFFESRDSKLGNRSRVWLPVFISAGLFSMVHGNVPHWPALFLLGVCMGYAYEKSGSLFRSIFIHALFNSIAVTFILLGL